jgi:hypothetical protein
MHIVFPTIRSMGGKLVQLDNDTALEIAKQKKDYVTFDSGLKKVVKGLKKASKTHAQQAKIAH